MAAKDEVALVPLEKYEVARFGIAETIALVRENLGDGVNVGPLDLERVTIPPQGGTKWQVPDVVGETRDEATITGVIIAHSPVRLYWAQSIDEGGAGKPPDCLSENGVTGVPADETAAAEGGYGGLCAKCKMNQWSSTSKTNSRAKACTERHHVLLLMPDSLLPRLVSLPPSSLGNWRAYMLGLAGQVKRPYYGVLTELGLNKTTNAQGIAYAEATFRMAGLVPDEVVPRLQDMAAQFKALTTVGEADFAAADA